MQALVNLFCLSSNVRLYVPSTTDVTEALSQEEHERFVRRALSDFSRWFGGSTAHKALGCWLSGNGTLVQEPVTIVESYCSETSLQECITYVVDLARALKQELGQEAVSVEVNGKLYFV